jgi:uncharacterized protein (DUF927 family)
MSPLLSCPHNGEGYESLMLRIILKSAIVPNGVLYFYSSAISRVTAVSKPNTSSIDRDTNPMLKLVDNKITTIYKYYPLLTQVKRQYYRKVTNAITTAWKLM